MPGLHHVSIAQGSDPLRVFVAMPTYGAVPAAVAGALLATQQAFSEAGIGCEVAILAGNCHVDDARNELVAAFLRSDCTDMLFIDADVQWRAGELIRLLRHDVDIVAGLYRKKQTGETYPVRNLAGAKVGDDGLLEVEAVPGGMLRIRRDVFGDLCPNAQWYEIENTAGEKMQIPQIFERITYRNQRFSGDYAFCRKARAAGVRIFVDVRMKLAHIGEQSWTGSYGTWLNRQSGNILGGLNEIKAGVESPETFERLYDEWDNDGFAATPEFLMAATWMAREASSDILETGSGLTTLCMAAANPLITINCLEHSPQWADKLMRAANTFHLDNIIIHEAPLVHHASGMWYDTATLNPRDWGIVVCDGPPRAQGDRAVLFDAVNINGAMVLMDDANDPAQLGALTGWSAKHGREVETLGKARLFALSWRPQA